MIRIFLNFHDMFLVSFLFISSLRLHEASPLKWMVDSLTRVNLRQSQFFILRIQEVHFFTGTGSAAGRTTSSSAFFPFLKAIAVEVPMKLKKRMAAGISWRRMMIAPIMMKIQRAAPAPLRLMLLAKAGDAIKVMNPTVNPTFNPFIIFSIFISSLLLFSILTFAFGMPNRRIFYNYLKLFIFYEIQEVRLVR